MIKPIYRIYGPGYVAAIIQGTFEMGQYLISVPKERLETLKVEPLLGQRSYPLKLIEAKTQEGQIFFLDTTDEKSAKDMIGKIGAKVLVVYDINEDFLGDPKFPGKDNMGILPHAHEHEE